MPLYRVLVVSTRIKAMPPSMLRVLAPALPFALLLGCVVAPPPPPAPVEYYYEPYPYYPYHYGLVRPHTVYVPPPHVHLSPPPPRPPPVIKPRPPPPRRPHSRPPPSRAYRGHRR
ncbi:MAG: hypothetical protein FWD46_07645 [Cystobacterineae bacterium]|nr:hypothetical protein [Cystobacterineae bacterium]